jgi:hypothetical protein
VNKDDAEKIKKPSSKQILREDPEVAEMPNLIEVQKAPTTSS